MALSVIIPTYNRSRLLRRTLEALCRQESIAQILEVIVVSDGSTDDTAATVHGFLERIPIRLVVQPNLGVSAARNRGLLEACGQVVLFLDDDVVPGERLIVEHVQFHIQNPNLESVLLGYVTWLQEIRVTPFMRWYGEYGALFGYAMLRDGKQVDRRYLYTCNISFKNAFIRQNGGFDETLTVHEDHELGYRLSRVGMRMFFWRNAVGYHNQSFTFQQACDRIGRYSSGFAAFRATEAGQEMSRNQVWWKRKVKGIFISRPKRPSRLLSSILDSNFPLPKAAYRLAYWYFATLPYANLGLTKD